MRAIPLLFVASMVAVAPAQVNSTTLVNEQRLNLMFQRLVVRATDPMSGQVGLSLTTTGVDRIDTVASTFGSQLFYRFAPATGTTRADLKLSLAKYMKPDTAATPTKVYEAVGDGKTLWQYNGASLTYSASPYDLGAANDPNAQSPTYVRDALFALNQGSGGNDGSSYATRMLRELCGGTSAAYRSWMPGFNLVEQGAPYQDPLTGLYRDPTSGGEAKDPPSATVNLTYLVYNASPRRAIAFEIYQDSTKDTTDPDYETIQRIYVTDASVVRGKKRYVSWSLLPVPTTSFASANFVPYNADQIKGYRPVVAPGAIKF